MLICFIQIVDALAFQFLYPEKHRKSEKILYMCNRASKVTCKVS